MFHMIQKWLSERRYPSPEVRAKYITRGKAIDIHWTKDFPKWGKSAHYYDSNNQEIQLNPGKTWVEIVLNDSVGSVSLQ